MAANESPQDPDADAGADAGLDLRSLQEQARALGIEAARALFRHMVTAAALDGPARTAAEAEIAGFSPSADVGCLSVEYYDLVLQDRRLAYLFLDACPRDHYLGAQLDKLRVRCANDKWVQVLGHLSVLVRAGRAVYAQVAQAHSALLGVLAGKLAAAGSAAGSAAELCNVRVDPVNTTLYLRPDWPVRVGIFVQLSSMGE